VASVWMNIRFRPLRRFKAGRVVVQGKVLESF